MVLAPMAGRPTVTRFVLLLLNGRLNTIARRQRYYKEGPRPRVRMLFGTINIQDTVLSHDSYPVDDEGCTSRSGRYVLDRTTGRPYDFVFTCCMLSEVNGEGAIVSIVSYVYVVPTFCLGMHRPLSVLWSYRSRVHDVCRKHPRDNV